MRFSFILLQRPAIVAALSGAAALVTLTGCGLHPDPPPSIPTEAFSGTGDRMAQCMQYASQSYCEQEIWGGGLP